MNRGELNEFVRDFYQKGAALAELKNEDYASTQDALLNFKASGWPEIGFYTRMMDKMQRLRSFIDAGSLKVQDESVEDTLMDLANYSALFAAYLKDLKLNHESKSYQPARG